MARQIGKYLVTPRLMSIGGVSPGQNRVEHYASVVLTWEEGGQTKERRLSFDSAFETADAAAQNVYEQIGIRVREGEL